MAHKPTLKILQKSNGGDNGNNDLHTRVTLVENDISHIQQDISEIKNKTNTISDKLAQLELKITNRLWLIGIAAVLSPHIHIGQIISWFK